MKRIAIDIHGVLDANPEYFLDLAQRTLDDKGDVHIITGSEWSPKIEEELLMYSEKVFGKRKVFWTHFASVITILQESGADMYYNPERGHFCVKDNEVWDKVKGDYCRKHQIDEIYDDTIQYRKHMPEFTHFFLYSHNPVEHEAKLKRKHLGSN